MNNYRMKHILFFLVAFCSVSMAWGVNLPQFSGTNYEGWVYSRDDRELNSGNINGNLITLFTTGAGNQYTLTSPEFSTYGLDSLIVTTTWHITKDNQHFDLSKTELTVALVDANGETMDSVKCMAPNKDQFNHKLVAQLGRNSNWPKLARLRLVAWLADEWSCGAVRKVEVEGVVGGDVNGDGEVGIADVTLLVNALLTDSKDLRYDVNHDGEVSIADVTALVNLLLDS